MTCPQCNSEMVKAKATDFGQEYDYCRGCKKELSEMIKLEEKVSLDQHDITEISEDTEPFHFSLRSYPDYPSCLDPMCKDPTCCAFPTSFWTAGIDHSFTGKLSAGADDYWSNLVLPIYPVKGRIPLG